MNDTESGVQESTESGGGVAHAAVHRAQRGHGDVSGCECGARRRPLDRQARLVAGCGAGVAVLLGALALGAQARGRSSHGAAPGRRDGAGGSVRCIVSLTSAAGAQSPPGLVAGLARSVAGAMSVDERDVAVTASRLRSASTLDVGIEMRAAADADAAALARRLRKHVDGGRLDALLGSEGLAITAAFRARPHPFSAAGLPETFNAADQADTALVAGLLVPILFLLPALVFFIFQYQLVERLVWLRAAPLVQPPIESRWALVVLAVRVGVGYVCMYVNVCVRARAWACSLSSRDMLLSLTGRTPPDGCCAGYMVREPLR
jgi:hypothetical protein